MTQITQGPRGEGAAGGPAEAGALTERSGGSATADQRTMDRRELVGYLTRIGAGSLAAALVSEGPLAAVTAPSAAWAAVAGSQSGVQRKYRYGMVIDTRRCVGCRACVVACKAENKTPPGVSYRRVQDEPIWKRFDDKPRFVSQSCNHCENPPCVPVCPVAATYKREQDGIVVVDYERCIGCRLCMEACPYGARFYDDGQNYPAVAERTAYAGVPAREYGRLWQRAPGMPPVGKVRKCHFCVHLQDAEGRYDRAAGRWPACAKTCPGHAIFFGDFNDPQSEVSRLRSEHATVRLKEELGTEPNVYYIL